MKKTIYFLILTALIAGTAEAQQAAPQGQQNPFGQMAQKEAGAPAGGWELAFKWCKKAAETGAPDAEFDLATMYHKGQGTMQSSTEAFHWYMKAAEQGLADAQVNMAAMYSLGDGTDVNQEEAVKWFRKAADAGSPLGQLNLGDMYAGGQGVKQDKVEALSWYLIASTKGGSHLGLAMQRVLGVQQGMTKEEIAKAENKAKEFKPVQK